MRRHAVLVGGSALLVAASSLVLSLGVLAQQASGSVRLPVSEQMEHQLILSAHLWLSREGINVSVANISILSGQPTVRTQDGPLAAFVARDHRYYGSACLMLHGPYPIPPAKPGDLLPSPLRRSPLCVLFSKSSQNKSWMVRDTTGSSCGDIGVVLRGLWGRSIPVCRIQPILYQL